MVKEVCARQVNDDDVAAATNHLETEFKNLFFFVLIDPAYE